MKYEKLSLLWKMFKKYEKLSLLWKMFKKYEKLSLLWKMFKKVVFIVSAFVLVVMLILVLAPIGSLKSWNWDWKEWAILGMVLILIVGLYFLLFLLAKAKLFITFIRSGETIFTMLGENLSKIIPNLLGYKLVKNRTDLPKKIPVYLKKLTNEEIGLGVVIPIPKEEKQMGLSKWLGIYWVGIPPFAHVLKYQFNWDKIALDEEREKETGGKVEETEFSNVKISHRSESVDSLYFRYVYPLIVRDIELSGQFKVSIFFNITVETVIPYIAIILLKGKWLSPFMAAISGKISDVVKDETATEDTKNSGGNDQTTVDNIAVDNFEKINKETVFRDAIKGNRAEPECPGINEMLVKTTGMIAAEVVYSDYVITGNEETQAALTGREIAKINKERVITEAEGAAASIEKIGKAEGNALSSRLKAALEHDEGVNVLITQTFTDGLKGFRGDVLSLGGKVPGLQLAIEKKQKEKKGEQK